ncbi:MAG: hypothetical protein HKN32_05650 [Flavobacteriales bacterium]|nr:hypothetical protein [Flavobacteriales bacterium]
MSGSPFKGGNRRSLTTSFSTVLGITLVLLTIGLMAIVLFSAKAIGDNFREGLVLPIMLREQTPEPDIKKLKAELQAESFTSNIEYISKEEAAAQHIQELGEDFVAFLGENPLPASFNLYLNAAYTEKDSLAWIVPKLENIAMVKEVVYHPKLFDEVVTNVTKVTLGLAILMGLLLFISIALINNTIRLAVFSKRFIIKSMQLVGATRGFIRRPFIWKGIGLGLLSAVLAVAILTSLMYFFREGMFGFIADVIVGNEYYIPIFGVILVMGVLISWFSTHLAVSRFIRLRSDKLY